MSTMRRALVAVLLALAAAPAAAQATPGDFAGRVQIAGGRWMYIECRGRGGPTVVLESGLRNIGAIWSTRGEPGQRRTVFGSLRRRTRVCLYDRPGTTLLPDRFSQSSPAPMPRTTNAAARDLDRLLRAARGPGPYVLVGHSTGGLIVRRYAVAHPHRVAGMVQVDALSEFFGARLDPAQARIYSKLNNDPIPGLDYPDLERIQFFRSFSLMRRASRHEPPLRVPAVVLRHTLPFDIPSDLPAGLTSPFLERAWRASQGQVARSLPGSQLIAVAGAAHYVMLDRPGVVIHQIRRVIRAARAGRHHL